MTPDAILEQLDLAARKFMFPMLDNGYIYPADVRLSIFRDPSRWLMIVEVLGILLCCCSVVRFRLAGRLKCRSPGRLRNGPEPSSVVRYLDEQY
jgi:uncharacterized protein DUF7003